jgi:hypothetical protein
VLGFFGNAGWNTVSFDLKAGWNTVEFLLNQWTGNAYVNLGLAGRQGCRAVFWSGRLFTVGAELDQLQRQQGG